MYLVNFRGLRDSCRISVSNNSFNGSKYRGVTVGGAGGAIALPPFGKITGAAGSGDAPP